MEEEDCCNGCAGPALVRCICCQMPVCSSCSRVVRRPQAIPFIEQICNDCPKRQLIRQPPTEFFDAALDAKLRELFDIDDRVGEIQTILGPVPQRGLTALHYAVIGGHTNVAEFLIALKANTLACDETGAIALYYACQKPRLLKLLPPAPLRSLDLSSRDLAGLAPNFLSHFPNLTSLNLSNNHLTTLPNSFLSLTALTQLNLAGNPKFRLPTQLGELRTALEARAAQKCAGDVTVLLTGPGSRSWLLKPDAPPALRRCQTRHPTLPINLLVVDCPDPVTLELVLAPRVLYVICLRQLDITPLDTLFAKIALVGHRLKPPVWIVADGLASAPIQVVAECRREAEALARRFSINLAAYYALAPSDMSSQDGLPPFLTLGKEIRESLYDSCRHELFAKPMPAQLVDHAARLAAMLHKSPVVSVARLELLVEPALVQQLLGKASQTGAALLHHHDLVSPQFAASVFQRIAATKFLYLQHQQLFDASSLSTCSATVRQVVLALFARLGLVIPFDSARYVVPSNAPVLSPLPALPQPEYLRIYRLRPPLGFTRRLAARLAHFPGAILYRQHVLLLPGSNVAAMVTFGVENTVTLQVQAHSSALKLFLDLLTCVEGLLAEVTVRAERLGMTKDGNLVSLTQGVDLQLTPDWEFARLPIGRPLLADGRQIGKGAGGSVHACTWLGSPVAVKTFSAEVPLPAVAREVSIALSMEHPNIVLSLAVVKSPLQPSGLVMEHLPLQDLCHGFHYPDEQLAMQRLALKATQNALDQSRAAIMQNYASRGHELDELNRGYAELEQRQAAVREATAACDRQLSLRLRVLILLDVALALSALHACTPPILHNDVRSPNIFLVSLEPLARVHAKLGDFGLAQRLFGSCRLRLLTWQWLAPEVLRGDDFGRPSDVFSLGVVAWELLHGPGFAVPYDCERGTPGEIRERIWAQNLRPAVSGAVRTQFASDPLFRGLLRVMTDCWQPDPERRPSAATVSISLQLLLEDRRESNELTESPSPPLSHSPSSDFAEDYSRSDFEELTQHEPQPASSGPEPGPAPSPSLAPKLSEVVWPETNLETLIRAERSTSMEETYFSPSAGFMPEQDGTRTQTPAKPSPQTEESKPEIVLEINKSADLREAVAQPTLTCSEQTYDLDLDQLSPDDVAIEGLDLDQLSDDEEPTPQQEVPEKTPEQKSPENLLKPSPERVLVATEPGTPPSEKGDSASQDKKPGAKPDQRLQSEDPVIELLLATVLGSGPIPAILQPWRGLLESLTSAAALPQTTAHQVLLRVCAARQLVVTPKQYARHASALGEFEVVMAVLESDALLDSVDACLLATGQGLPGPVQAAVDPHLAALVTGLSALVTVAYLTVPPSAEAGGGSPLYSSSPS